MKVVDSNVLIHGRGSLPGELYTVPGVMEEMKSKDAKQKFDSISLTVEEPSRESLEKVRQKSDEIDSPTSGVDEALVALAIDLGAELLTDDMAAQNLALHLGADFSGFIEGEVEEKRCWKRICENCGKTVEGDKCSRCGSSSIRLRQGPCN